MLFCGKIVGMTLYEENLCMHDGDGFSDEYIDRMLFEK